MYLLVLLVWSWHRHGQVKVDVNCPYFNHNKMSYIWWFLNFVKIWKAIIICLIFMVKMLCSFTYFIHIIYILFIFMETDCSTWFYSPKIIKSVYISLRLEAKIDDFYLFSLLVNIINNCDSHNVLITVISNKNEISLNSSSVSDIIFEYLYNYTNISNYSNISNSFLIQFVFAT